MEYRRLGRLGPDLSAVGYGGWEIGGEAWGPNPDEAEIVRTIHAALDSGINWIDTAEIYGAGVSEQLIGRALKGRSDHVLVATKVAPEPAGTGYGVGGVRRAALGSLERLGVERIDLFQLHWIPEEMPQPLEDVWAGMGRLVDEGLVRCVGLSNVNRGQVERCMKVRHVDAVQLHLSMLYRHAEDLAAWCAEQGVGVVTYGSLAYGILAGAVERGQTFEPSDWRSGQVLDIPYREALFGGEHLDGHLDRVEALRPVADRMGVTLAQLALAWVLHRPGVTSAIAGSRDPAHTKENARGADLPLNAKELDEIERILAG